MGGKGYVDMTIQKNDAHIVGMPIRATTPRVRTLDVSLNIGDTLRIGVRRYASTGYDYLVGSISSGDNQNTYPAV